MNKHTLGTGVLGPCFHAKRLARAKKDRAALIEALEGMLDLYGPLDRPTFRAQSAIEKSRAAIAQAKEKGDVK